MARQLCRNLHDLRWRSLSERFYISQTRQPPSHITWYPCHVSLHAPTGYHETRQFVVSGLSQPEQTRRAEVDASWLPLAQAIPPCTPAIRDRSDVLALGGGSHTIRAKCRDEYTVTHLPRTSHHGRPIPPPALHWPPLSIIDLVQTPPGVQVPSVYSGAYIPAPVVKSIPS